MTELVSNTKALLVVEKGADNDGGPVAASPGAERSPSSRKAEEVGKALGLTGAVDTGSEEEAAAAPDVVDGSVAGRSSSSATFSGVVAAADEGAGADEAAGAGEAGGDDGVFAAAATAGTLRVTPTLLQRLWAKVRVTGRMVSIGGLSMSWRGEDYLAGRPCCTTAGLET